MRHKLTGKALVELIGKVGYRWSDTDDTIHYFGHDNNFVPPTEEQIKNKIAELQDEYEKQAYARLREGEYPSTKHLIVALWEKVIEGRSESADALEVKRQEVKIAHPKPK